MAICLPWQSILEFFSSLPASPRPQSPPWPRRIPRTRSRVPVPTRRASGLRLTASQQGHLASQSRAILQPLRKGLAITGNCLVDGLRSPLPVPAAPASALHWSSRWPMLPGRSRSKDASTQVSGEWLCLLGGAGSLWVPPCGSGRAKCSAHPVDAGNF